ncbi:multivesicular body subunit 12B-like [Brachionus plicatilis]|uniref:Multivesicular body subunit 12B-like n=1 Tax=Brachionus plicatilis TaxID=10195 RepID=A0A3M7PPZ2_BRAPC|nr:multivesicular body subunit 12B-like [Brachionus plicatilis]
MIPSQPELPITALCVVADKGKCPANYTPVFKSYDTNTETDLWKDSIFGKKINRFICFTKDYPINDTFNVIEDIKLLNDREILSGFIPIDKCYDTSERAFQKKILCIKVSQRFYTPTAVSDLIILIKNKRPPTGYSYIGEINGQSICIKFSQIPNNSPTFRGQSKPVGPPPVPPRPYQTQPFSPDTIENDYVHIMGQNELPNAIYNNQQFNTNRSMSSNQNSLNVNPLHGVPFEINPVYQSLKNASQKGDAEKIDKKLAFFMQMLDKIEYDFNLERSCLEISKF